MTPSRMQITIELIVCSNEIASFFVVTTEPVKRWLEFSSLFPSIFLFRTWLSFDSLELVVVVVVVRGTSQSKVPYLMTKRRTFFERNAAAIDHVL